MTDDSRQDTPGATGAAGATSDRPRWADYSEEYRSDWESRHGGQRSWTDHEDAYRYGWEAAHDARYRGRDFTGVAADLEQGWPFRYDRAGEGYLGGRAETLADTTLDIRGTAQPARETGTAQRREGPLERAWNDFKDTVREGFERARMQVDQRT